MTSPASVAHHKGLSPTAASLRVALVTASDSRTPDTNEGGRLLHRLIGEAGFTVASEVLLAEEPTALRDAVVRLARDSDAVIVTGGTGIGPRDRTPDAVGALFERRLPGFGELFRMLSFQEIGPAAMLSRATAGLAGRTIIIALPGSEQAVRLGMEKLVLPEIGHLVREARR
jgi:molybdopterin adenylyltransferase